MNIRIYSHRDLIVYQKSFEAGRNIFAATRHFPREEIYSLTDQVRRSARSVSANIAEAWRRRRYEKAFISSLNNSEAEAAETQVWIDYALDHGYINSDLANQLDQAYEEVLRMIVAMINQPEKWCLGEREGEKGSGGAGSGGVRETESQYFPDIEAPTIDQSDLEP